MSKFDKLPPDLAALDQQLAELPQMQPSPALRRRIEVSIAEALSPEGRWSWGWFSAAAAVMLLLVGNLSMSAAVLTYVHMSSPRSTPVYSHSVDRLQELLPELSRQDASHHAVLLDAAGRIMPYPKMSATVHSLKRIDEE